MLARRSSQTRAPLRGDSGPTQGGGHGARKPAPAQLQSQHIHRTSPCPSDAPTRTQVRLVLGCRRTEIERCRAALAGGQRLDQDPHESETASYDCKGEASLAEPGPTPRRTGLMPTVLEKLNGKGGRAKQRRHNSWSIRGSQTRVHAWGGCDELQAVQCSAFELVPWSEVQRMLVEVLGRGAVAAMQRMQVRVL